MASCQIHVLAFGRDFFPGHARWYHSRHESHAKEVCPSSTESLASLSSQIGHIHCGLAAFAFMTSSTRSHASHVKYFLIRYTSMLGSVILAGRRSGGLQHHLSPPKFPIDVMKLLRKRCGACLCCTGRSTESIIIPLMRSHPLGVGLVCSSPVDASIRNIGILDGRVVRLSCISTYICLYFSAVSFIKLHEIGVLKLFNSCR